MKRQRHGCLLATVVVGRGSDCCFEVSELLAVHVLAEAIYGCSDDGAVFVGDRDDKNICIPPHIVRKTGVEHT